MLPRIITIVITVIRLFEFILLARAVLSWFQNAPGRFARDAFRVTYTLTEPVVAPVRSLLRRIFPGNQMVLMFTTLVAMLLLEAVCWVLRILFF